MVTYDLVRGSADDAYRVLTRLIVPRPIALVATQSLDGVLNLAPFSYFMLGGSAPPSCAICAVDGPQGHIKDTLRNLRAIPELTISLCTATMAEAMNQSSFAYPADVDEFSRTGLTPRPSMLVTPPGVAESPVHLECRCHAIHGHGHGPLASHYVIVEVCCVHVMDDVVIDGVPDSRRLSLLARMGGDDYLRTTAEACFVMPGPTKP